MSKLAKYIVSLVAFFALGIGVYNFLSEKRIAYVRSAVVMQQYEGMKDVQHQLQKEIAEWESNIDTIEKQLEKKVADYKMAQKTNTDTLRRKKILEIQKLRMKLQKYQSKVSEKAAQKEEALTSGVLNQVNSFIDRYAEENGYDVIFGTTTSGNLLYANDALDITDDFTKALNQNYKAGN